MKEALERVRTELLDIAERAEQECENRKRAGEKLGNYSVIAKSARRALMDLERAQR